VRRAALLVVFLLACGDDVPATITINAPPAWSPAMAELVTLTPYRALTLGEGGAFAIDLVEDASLPAEGYRLSLVGETIEVRAPDLLGAQYGASAALEGLGFRFRHPFDAHVPREPAIDPTAFDGALHAPEIRVRGFQLHTLHPIESYYAFWEPSPGSTNDAHRIIDWMIKNRGNYLHWVALDDIRDPSRGDPWRAFTRELIDYAHARGVRVGLNIQLFGQSNLQQAYDLVDTDPAVVPVADQIAARLPTITKDLPFDVYEVSFGEFFNADPASFISSLNEMKNQLGVFAPQAEVRAFIHVGAEQRIQYMGEDLLYYFLVKYADPAIIHDVHTTMFYNLFETASGAYHHAEFDEHREYLLQQICAGRRPGYVPETAYWIAFDNSVPLFLPLYVHNRWLDLDQIRAQTPCDTPLDTHVIFSTGWEWGYWLHDVATLRASYELPTAPSALVAHAFGSDLAEATAPVMALSDLQREYLHLGDLMAYVASRDVSIDLGRQLDIVSQPDRVTFADIVAGVGVEDARGKIAALREYADKLDAIAKQMRRASLPSDIWGRELRDGFEIDQLRTRFVIASYEAVLAHVDGDAATARTRADAAADLMDDAKEVVARRHADMHDTHGRRLLEKSSDENGNRTIYQYGYLYMADILCFWQRELVQVEGILGRTSAAPPGCLLP
jgi:hypothetical protein